MVSNQIGVRYILGVPLHDWVVEYVGKKMNLNYLTMQYGYVIGKEGERPIYWVKSPVPIKHKYVLEVLYRYIVLWPERARRPMEVDDDYFRAGRIKRFQLYIPNEIKTGLPDGTG